MAYLPGGSATNNLNTFPSTTAGTSLPPRELHRSRIAPELSQRVYIRCRHEAAIYKAVSNHLWTPRYFSIKGTTRCSIYEIQSGYGRSVLTIISINVAVTKPTSSLWVCCIGNGLIKHRITTASAGKQAPVTFLGKSHQLCKAAPAKGCDIEN